MQQEKMRHVKTRIKLYLISAYVTAATLVASQAEAAQIQNLSGKPQTFATGGQTKTPASGEIYYHPGRVVVIWHGREVAVEHNEEYVIWDDTTFGPQRRVGRHGAGSL